MSDTWRNFLLGEWSFGEISILHDIFILLLGRQLNLAEMCPSCRRRKPVRLANYDGSGKLKDNLARPILSSFKEWFFHAKFKLTSQNISWELFPISSQEWRILVSKRYSKKYVLFEPRMPELICESLFFTFLIFYFTLGKEDVSKILVVSIV